MYKVAWNYDGKKHKAKVKSPLGRYEYCQMLEKEGATDIKIKYTGINIKENTNLSPKYDRQTIYIISADFSHHKLFHEAIDLENKAAKSMMFRDYSDTHYNQVVDDIRSF